MDITIALVCAITIIVWIMGVLTLAFLEEFVVKGVTPISVVSLFTLSTTASIVRAFDDTYHHQIFWGSVSVVLVICIMYAVHVYTDPDFKGVDL